jgi:hypothetical protein
MTTLLLDRRLALAGVLLLGSLAWADADPKRVLKVLGEEARGQENAGLCRYRETTTVEELGKEGEVIGSEVRVFEVETRGTEVTRRESVSVKPEGEPLADLLQQPRDTKGPKAARSPLHPQAQKDYRFEVKEGPEAGELTLSIDPVKPSMTRLRGQMVLDARTTKPKTLSFSPSKVPPLLKAFSSRYEYGDTACGRMPVVMENEGEGVDIFVETKFRTRSVLDNHVRVPGKVKTSRRDP